MKKLTKLGVDRQAMRSAVKHLLEIANQASADAQTKFGRNVVDPFSMLFEIAGFGMSYREWELAETQRQAQKTLQNHVGELHQKLLGAIPGWSDLSTGSIIDVVNPEKRIIAEVKNKYNTIKGSDQVKLYDQLYSLVKDKGQQYRGYTAYYVKIIPRKAVRFDKPFTPSDSKNSGKRQADEQIREIDGYSFYELATGRADALTLIHDDLIDITGELLVRSGRELSATDKQRIAHFFKKAFSPKLPSA
jgi:Eco47II restriction endonuclease